MPPSWSFMEPTPDGQAALMQPHTGSQTLGKLRLGVREAGALGAKISSLVSHAPLKNTLDKVSEAY